MTRRGAFFGFLGALLLAAGVGAVPAKAQIDSDHDGLNDAVEEKLLLKFEPRFMVGKLDCSTVPAEFKAGVTTPEVEAENGTIYGQVFPLKIAVGMRAEIHYYHLWRKDCGGHGHPLDTEHVAVLVERATADADWRAVYWYAGAHEQTVCDVSQIARASTIDAEDHGATVWVSPGKHASYLNEALCRGGCGADRCEKMTELPVAAVINLGEADAPMNGSLFIASAAWPLRAKMSQSNFPAGPVARLETLPVTDIAWFHAGRHPVQGIIARSSSTEEALAGSGRNTASAISVAGSSTGSALDTASESTGGALSSAGGAVKKGYRSTIHALGSSASHVGKALGVAPKTTPKKNEEEPR
jgi:hypothetical protein